MSTINVANQSVSSWNAGHGSVGETAQALSTGAPAVKKHIVVRADAGNSGTITVGPNAGAASGGFVLGAGEQTPPIFVDDLKKVWVVGSGSDQAYSWVCS
jgi:hypothetical protein